jgi:hypothetical protein
MSDDAGLPPSDAAPGQPAPKPGDARAGMLADGIALWARAAEQLLRNSIGLWRLPIEFGQAEDPQLSVSRTSVYFPAVGDTGAKLEAGTVTDARTGERAEVTVTRIEPNEYQGPADAREITIEVELPPQTTDGLFEVTLVNQGGEPISYILPFGVPSPSRARRQRARR